MLILGTPKNVLWPPHRPCVLLGLFVQQYPSSFLGTDGACARPVPSFVFLCLLSRCLVKWGSLCCPAWPGIPDGRFPSLVFQVLAVHSKLGACFGQNVDSTSPTVAQPCAAVELSKVIVIPCVLFYL